MQALVEAVRAAGVRDERVLAAVSAVPREHFVPAGQERHAYLDIPLPIPHEQVTTQPSLVARMLEGLELAGGERVLEIGSGHGWQTALLCRLAGSVWSIERYPDLADTARANLSAHGVENAEVIVGDGSLGLPEQAPFDAIVVSAAAEAVPDPLREQLLEGGRLVIPLGPGGAEDVVLFRRESGSLTAVRTITGACFVRLVGQHGFEA